MKMRNFVFSLIFVFYINSAVSQAEDFNLNIFKHNPWKKNNQFLIQILEKYPLENDTIYYKIPVTLWIYPDKRTGFGPGYNEIKNQIQRLNYYFNKINNTGLYFYIADINIIPSKTFQNIGYIGENTLISLINHQAGTVNIHLVNNLRLNLLLYKLDFGGTYNPITKSLIISRSNFPTGLAHEMGHYFGLLHPHRNWKGGKLLAEAVDRNKTVKNSSIRNCEARGDYLCDTPAEPDLSQLTNDSCKYTGSVKDPWGEPYSPLTDNIMSYQKNKRCRKHFTQMQIAVMIYNVSKNKYAKYWANTPENFFIQPDSYEPDDFIQISTMLEPFNTQYHTFHYIYTAKKMKQDKADFYIIYLDQNAKNYITIEKAKYAFPQMKITIYDNFYKPILTKYIADPAQIKLPITATGTLYISLKPLPSTTSLYDYFITYKVLK